MNISIIRFIFFPFQGGILNLSRKQKLAIAEQVAKEIEDDERRPLLRDASKPSIN